MSLPTDGLSLLWYALLVVPGAVFIGVRTLFQGVRDSDRSVSSKVFAAFLASVFFDLVYLALLSWLVPYRSARLYREIERALPEAALLALVLAFVVPALVGWLLFGVGWFAKVCGWLRSTFTNSRRRGTPTAWDLATFEAPGEFVRVRIGPGQWVGGLWSERGYFSSYPEPRDLYIEQQYHVDSEGGFGEPVDGSAGFWIHVKDEYIVEWVKGGDVAEQS